MHSFFFTLPISDEQIHLSLFENISVWLIKRYNIKWNLFETLFVNQVIDTFRFSHWKLLGNGTVTKQSCKEFCFIWNMNWLNILIAKTQASIDSQPSLSPPWYVIKDITKDWFVGLLTEPFPFPFLFGMM